MGNLGDALKKAGLIEENRRGSGRRPPRSPRAERPPDAEKDAARRRALEAANTPEEVLELIKAHARPPGGAGDRRFHYQAPDGRLPFLLVDREGGRLLEGGECGIAWDGRRARVVPRDLAEKAATLDPGLLLHLSRPRS